MTLPEVGVHRSTPAAVYHAWDAASNSRLTKLKRSPAHLRASIASPTNTAALMLGRAAHSAILEPDDFTATYMTAGDCQGIKKDGAKCSNGGVVFHEKSGWLCGVHCKGLPGGFDLSRIVLPAGDHAACVAMRDAVHAHESARGIMAGPRHVELSLRWDDAETSLACKARLDCSAPELAGGTVWDVKTTTDASPAEFERSIYRYGYHRQGAMYLDACVGLGIPARHFVIVAVEKEAPFAVAVYRLTEAAIDAGRQQLQPLIRRYAACVEQNQWPGYPSHIQDIGLPAYAWKQIDFESSEAA